jgi:site-specific DNA-cytosine methylase
LTAIDLFAGAGGFTLGATMAGARVLWAANHWEAAVQVHATNHPEALHLCQDLHQANWETVPRHDLLLASPSCQGHSRARGTDQPRHDAARSTAWAVVSCAEFHRPSAFVVENVPEFQEWGPLRHKRDKKIKKLLYDKDGMLIWESVVVSLVWRDLVRVGPLRSFTYCSTLHLKLSLRWLKS